MVVSVSRIQAAFSSGVTLSDRCPSSHAHPWRFRDAFQGIAQRVFGDHLVHAEQSGIDAIAADCRHVRIASVARQHRERPGPQHFRLGRRITTGVAQRGAFQPTTPQSRQVEKLDEVGQLPHRRRRTLRLPAHLHSACHRLHPRARQQHFLAFRQLQFRLTHRVTPSLPTRSP